MSQRDKDVTFFVVWILNKAAQAWGKSPCEVYRALQGAGIVTDYLMGFYDTVHSMGEEAKGWYPRGARRMVPRLGKCVAWRAPRGYHPFDTPLTE